MVNRYQKIYSVLYFISLVIFLVNLIYQGQIIFTNNDLLGLIIKMSPIFWIGHLFLLILITFQFTNFNKIDQRFVYLTLILLVVYLIWTPFLHEYLARYPDAWIHSYLAQKMFETGKVVNHLGIYEEYPGTFLFYGLLFQVLPPYLVMKFLAPVLYMLGVAAIYLLFKRFFDSRVSFLVSVLYLFFNWTVEENHLSPQFLIFNLYLVFMLVLIKFFSSSKKDRIPYLLFLFLLIPVIVFSHPGTPTFLILILGSMLILCKRVRSLGFFLVFLFLVITFVTYTYYQSIHFESYKITISRFFDILQSGKFSGTTQRFVTTHLSRIIFLSSRITITVFSFIIGLMGILLLRKKKHKTESSLFIGWTFSMLLFTIFVSIGLKGEFYERFVLISSLPLAAVASYFLREFKVSGIMILILLLVLTPLYFVAKYGNEGFESVSLEKLKAECFSYNFYDNCDEKQEIVDTTFGYDLEASYPSFLSVTRENVLSTSLYHSMSQQDVEAKLESIILDRKLDKIYSSNTAAAYK